MVVIIFLISCIYCKYELWLLCQIEIKLIIIIKDLERNFIQIEMEALHHWNVWPLQLWEAFCSINRRRTLIWIPTEQKSIPCMKTARIQRGAITLSAYNYTIKYRLGSQNENIDFFSRYASKYVKGESSSIATNLNSYVHQ